MQQLIFLCVLLLSLASCQNESKNSLDKNSSTELNAKTLDSAELAHQANKKRQQILDSVRRAEKEKQIYFENLPDSAMIELIEWDSAIVLDIRYATENNFMKQQVYPCPKALLRKVAAQSLFEAHQKFQELGYRIKVYDGYRPLSVQWILWNKTTNKNYVANPRRGSNHNKGCAIDMTLVDSLGNELNMGTEYDFFGKAAHHTYTSFPEKEKATILANRKLLKSVMESVGFRAISNEWWHYDYKIKYPISDTPLPCQ